MSIYSLIDIGINLEHSSFDKDRAQVIQRSLDAGVEVLIATGTHLKSSQAAYGFSKKNPGVVFNTAGFHPHNAKLLDAQSLKSLEALLTEPEVVAVGECGLDFNRDFSPRPIQEQAFEAQLELAKKTGKPLFLHERDAHQRFVAIIKQYPSAKAVVHCFTGTSHELEVYLSMGFYIGITGWICDERRGHHLLPLLSKIPLNRLMVETDAPFLTPRDLKPQPDARRNEPAFLPHIVRAIARATKREAAEIAAETTKTAEEFFGLEPA
jgi:TatD DNase family protein